MYLGIDFGSTGARACVMAAGGQIEEMARLEFGRLDADEVAAGWREALFNLLADLPLGLRKRLQAVAVDGTSATLLACDEALNSVYPPLLYNDVRATQEADSIRRAAGPEHPAAMASSGLAKVLWLKQRLGHARARLYLNQADWLSALLSGRPVSDYHNALKMGLDPETGLWPAWVDYLVDLNYLPVAVKPGTAVALLERPRAAALGIHPDCLVRAGTTDSIAAFLAAGVDQVGMAVTSLGTTLVLKLLSETRVDASEYGIYSHWYGRYWLAGGASNAGAGVLRQHFSDAELIDLSARIEADRPSGLDYYPLPARGERFPINDPDLPARLEPRPGSRVEFLQGILEGLANIEAQGYQKLAALGATPLKSVITAGGGARNASWTRIRAARLGVPVRQAAEQEACYGAARLACFGDGLFPGGDDA